MIDNAITPGAKLRSLLGRTDGKVTSILAAVSAQQAKVMALAGIECAFVGTGLTIQNYTGFPDRGIASLTECTTFGGYIARAVDYPIILDGDTGHGTDDALKRMVRDSIREGLAGLRIDDQPIEFKRGWTSSGVQVVDQEAAVRRYRAAVEARDEWDPSFVIQAQCFARDSEGLDEALERIRLYGAEAGVDWVQMESAHSVEEIVQARDASTVYFSAPQGVMSRPLTLKEHAELGLGVAWYTFAPAHFLNAAALEFLDGFVQQGVEYWSEYQSEHAATFERLRSL